jgi:hypothetical protein
MATYIDLDSLHRDRENYPNENDYTVTASQVETWFTSARTIRALPANPILSIKEFVTTINIRDLALPYSDELAALPRIYIEFRSETYKDIRLINTIGGIHADTHFVCSPKRIQTDSNDIPIWIHYECHMEQTMRFEREDLFVFNSLLEMVMFFLNKIHRLLWRPIQISKPSSHLKSHLIFAMEHTTIIW